MGTTEIIPLCLRIMESGSELSKTMGTFILQKILLDETGLYYICQTYDRWSFSWPRSQVRDYSSMWCGATYDYQTIQELARLSVSVSLISSRTTRFPRARRMTKARSTG